MPKYRPNSSDMKSYVAGMLNLATVIEELNPDGVIVPLRGAYPFYATYEKISEIKGKKPKEGLFLPLGTCIDLQKNKKRGLTVPEKREVIDSYISSYLKENPFTKDFLLVDEVMQGGSIRLTYDLLSNYLAIYAPEIKINVCAVEDKRVGKIEGYKELKLRHKFNTIQIDNLFTLDRERFLPKVIKNKDFSVEIDNQKLNKIMSSLEEIIKTTSWYYTKLSRGFLCKVLFEII